MDAIPLVHDCGSRTAHVAGMSAPKASAPGQCRKGSYFIFARAIEKRAIQSLAKLSEMLDRITGTGGWGGRGCDAVLAGAFGAAFKRATDEVAGAKTHGESKR